MWCLWFTYELSPRKCHKWILYTFHWLVSPAHSKWICVILNLDPTYNALRECGEISCVSNICGHSASTVRLASSLAKLYGIGRSSDHFHPDSPETDIAHFQIQSRTNPLRNFSMKRVKIKSSLCQYYRLTWRSSKGFLFISVLKPLLSREGYLVIKSNTPLHYREIQA